MTGELWTQAPLRDVVEEWIIGSTPPRTNPEYFTQEGGTPWAKAEDVKGGTLYQTAERLSEAGGRQMRLVPKDAVLITASGTIGNIALAGRPLYCSQSVQALAFRKDTVLPLYGCYFLLSQRAQLLQLSRRTVIPHVSKGQLESLRISFPPLALQERMIAQMRVPEALRGKAAALQALLENYLQALTVREAGRSGDSEPIGALLAEPPLAGLRAKASPTGNGAPLVNKLGRNAGRLTDLKDHLRVQVSEKQISRYRLQPGDILLRSAAPGSGVRGVLVGELPEEALAGGNLVRLRLRPECSAPWLVTWLLGPGGDQLYVSGKLQKQLLQRYRVPVLADPRRFERQFQLYWALVEKAAQFAGQAQALFESVLHLVFFKNTADAAPFDWSGDRLNASLAKLTGPMNQFLQEMSQFQRELYHILLQSEDGQPAHILQQRMRGKSRKQAGIQDARSTLNLLEQFGLVERDIPRGIPRSEGRTAEYITDHNGRNILIDAYKPTEDLMSEG